MSHVHRFYVPPGAAQGSEISLEGEEAHHALHVVRVQVGDAVTLFDGEGGEFTGRVAAARKRDLRIEVLEQSRVPAARTRLTLVQAGLHRDNTMEFVVRHGAELGVSRFVFYRAARSERAPRPAAKWHRLAVEVCKQSGRSWLPEFAVAASLEEALEQAPPQRLLATRERPARPLRQELAGGSVALAVGPEGDFTPEELRLAMDVYGARPVSLGPATFRSEMAAVLGSALVLYECGELGTLPSDPSRPL